MYYRAIFFFYRPLSSLLVLIFVLVTQRAACVSSDHLVDKTTPSSSFFISGLDRILKSVWSGGGGERE